MLPFCFLFAALPPASAAPVAGDTESVAEGLTVVHGAVNGAFLRRGDRVLAVYGDPRDHPATVDTVLFTHHRRDVAWAGRALVAQGAKAVVPAAEEPLFTGVEAFWQDFLTARFHDYAQQSTKILAQPMPVARAVRGGETLDWEGLPIRVLDTPGYTRGSVSYLIAVGGKRVLFSGDLITGEGKLLDLYSLQDAIPEAKIGGYHGYAARLAQVIESLRKIEAEQPDLLVPAHGPVVHDPARAIRTLIERIQALYANYLSVDALRWYFHDEHVLAKAKCVLGPDARVAWLPMAETRPLPDWIVPIGNARLILSADGSGFLVDCGSRAMIDALKKMRAAWRLTALEHLFITHYHDDHTDQAQAAAAEFGAKVHACGRRRDVLEHPGDYHLPCLSPNPIRVSAPHAHGDSWRWKEFRFTIFEFPGQTLYHDALLVKKDGGETFFFIGDSFTPSGVDDYCLQNRNFMHEGQGLLQCLDVVEHQAPGAFLINQHVDPAFRFTPAQIERVRETLRKRRDLLAALLPWDDPNFGLDEGWAVFHPYAAQAAPGEAIRLAVRITNHSPARRTFRARIHLPAGLTLEGDASGSARIAPRADGSIGFRVRVAPNTPPGPRVVTADLSWEEGELREWCEALVVVGG